MKIADCEFCLRRRPLTKNLCRECLRMFEIANADIFTKEEPTPEEIKAYIEEEVQRRVNQDNQ